MARTSNLRPQDIAALARQAVDELTAVAKRGGADALQQAARRVLADAGGADALQQAARRVLADAGDRQLQQAIIELSVAAPDAVTGALVSAALERGDTELARVAADLLPDIRESPAAPQVLRQCFASPDPTIRRRALDAMESFSDPAVVALLPDALQDESDTVRTAAASTIGIIIGIARHPLRSPILAELAGPESALARAIIANEDAQVRRQAAQSMAFVNSDAALPILQALCRDEDSEVRQEAVLSLAGIGTPGAVEVVGTMLGDESGLVASSALDMLAGRLGGASRRLLDYIKKAMETDQVEVRRHAVLMLSRFDAASAVPLLQKAVADPDFEVARQAGEILRMLSPTADLGWLGDEMARQSAGERALSVWEAGNIGLQAGRAAEQAAKARALVPMLERALREGTASDKLHVVNELSGLVDVADSPAMQEALADADPAVRSRAADTLQYTRDAGLLVRAGRTHADPMVRRLAAEALVRNPGGPARPGGARPDIAFTSTRTLGMELFGYFLDALRDADEGVRQDACAAIREYAQSVGLVPVRTTVHALEELAAEQSASYLMQEDVGQTIEVVRKATVSARIVQRVNEVLARRGRVARAAHALRWDEGSGAHVVAPDVEAEIAREWPAGCRLSVEQAQGLQRALAAGGALEEETARRILGVLAHELAAALNCVTAASNAIRLIEQEGSEAALDRWAGAVQAAPKLDWGPHAGVAKLQRQLRRLGMRAWVAARWARESFAEKPSPDALAAAAEDDDDWVKLTALQACAHFRTAPPGVLDRLRALCEAHIGEPEYHEPVGLAVPLLLAGEAGDPGAMAEAALAEGAVDFRALLTWRLMLAAQQEQAAGTLESYLARGPVETLPRLCLALALRGAGHELSGLSVAPAPETGEWTETLCAQLALQAMANDAGAAARLEETLRGGQAQERYASAHYLALARVRSAAMVFSSIRDQDEAPLALRAFCAAALVRRGHPAGLAGLEMASRAFGGRFEADFAAQLCRAVEDTIPLMLECRAVNVGRFA